MQYFRPEYLLTPQGLRQNVLLGVQDGVILSIEDAEKKLPGELLSLPGVALLPGFVNVHSHVFQRQLRGKTHRPLSPQDSFWSWRKAMYAVAQELEPASLYEIARQTYREMLVAGYTTVGEFHYLHHQRDGRPYPRANAMSEALFTAAQEVGIRCVLLLTAYTQGDFQQPPEPAQARFCDASVDLYLQRLDALRQADYTVGMALHSVRALPEHWFRECAAYSRTYDLPIHIHADEQISEVEQCVAIYGCRPIELLARWGVLGPRTTIIHATHANEQEIELLRTHQCAVCVCPTTEGDLGDGIAPYKSLREGVTLAIGTDSNTRLDPWEELRWAEYSARMRYQERRILIDSPTASPSTLLFKAGTSGGAHALNLAVGEIKIGAPADFIAIDLQHPMLAGWAPDTLLDSLIFGASSAVCSQVWVAGRLVVSGTGEQLSMLDGREEIL